MKSRVTTAIVCLLYLSAALVIGVVHHHHSGGPLGHHSDCAACTWAVKAAADAPQVSPFAFDSTTENLLRAFDLKPHLAPSFSFSLSRAPPVTPA